MLYILKIESTPMTFVTSIPIKTKSLGYMSMKIYRTGTHHFKMYVIYIRYTTLLHAYIVVPIIVLHHVRMYLSHVSTFQIISQSVSNNLLNKKIKKKGTQKRYLAQISS